MSLIDGEFDHFQSGLKARFTSFGYTTLEERI